jgi:hypothetical protein
MEMGGVDFIKIIWQFKKNTSFLQNPDANIKFQKCSVNSIHSCLHLAALDIQLRDGYIFASVLHLKRRTLRKFSSGQATDHHNVYVVLLDQAVSKIRKVRLANPERDPAKPNIYVGLTGLNPEVRFANHKSGLKSSALVKRYGIRLLPELYAHLNPMPYAAAAQMEKDLTEDLRRVGYTVLGGH